LLLEKHQRLIVGTEKLQVVIVEQQVSGPFLASAERIFIIIIKIKYVLISLNLKIYW
jgi:hypothetical protein